MSRILVADDEENFRELLGMILTARGHRYESVGSGEEALEVIAREPIDLLLCDLIMGGMTGIETMQRAREIRPEIWVIAVTGSTQFARQAGSDLPLGAHALLAKPFRIEELVEMIDDLLPPS